MILIQAIRNAVVNDLVVRNVADLAAVPTGKAGRPSRSPDMEQARAVLHAAKRERLWPSVAVSKLGGIRTEEARVLRWSEVDLGCVQPPAPPGLPPLPLRWARCPTAEERQTEAEPDPLGSQLGDRDRDRSND
jgi:hypothetical protein